VITDFNQEHNKPRQKGKNSSMWARRPCSYIMIPYR
jgi:hypothetical protein